MPSPRASTAVTILAGAALLSWPAALNRYPIVFSDTFGYLEQGIEVYVAWDKPWIYGPLLVPLHARLTLWPIVAAQALLLSWMVWLVQRTLVPAPRRTAHLILVLILALGSAAPWFTSLVMADTFTPTVPLGLFILAYASPYTLSASTRILVATVTTIAIAAHLSHLVLAAACIAGLVLLRWRTPFTAWRSVVPLAAALSLLLSINAIGQHRLAISPYGSVYALARLVADGPAADTIRESCPGTGWYLCAWADKLSNDSDAFLWAPDGPMSQEGVGPLRLAPEASEIIRETIRRHPFAVARDALANTARQLVENRIGDALIPDYLDVTVRETLKAYFPLAEVARFDQGLQAQGRLYALAAQINPLILGLLAVGALATFWIAVRRAPPLAAFATLTLVAVLANAFATGALSGPHDRYGARIAWLVLLPPLLLALNPTLRAARPFTPATGPVPRLPQPATAGSSGG